MSGGEQKVRRAVALAVRDCLIGDPTLTEEQIMVAVIAELEIRAYHPGAATPTSVAVAENLASVLDGRLRAGAEADA